MIFRFASTYITIALSIHLWSIIISTSYIWKCTFIIFVCVIKQMKVEKEMVFTVLIYLRRHDAAACVLHSACANSSFVWALFLFKVILSFVFLVDIFLYKKHITLIEYSETAKRINKSDEGYLAHGIVSRRLKVIIALRLLHFIAFG